LARDARRHNAVKIFQHRSDETSDTTLEAPLPASMKPTLPARGNQPANHRQPSGAISFSCQRVRVRLSGNCRFPAASIL
jgi:hypothetical protein